MLTLYRISTTGKLVIVDSATPPLNGVAVTIPGTTTLANMAPFYRTLDATDTAPFHPAELFTGTPEAASSYTNWNDITGAGKPENNATLGANAINLKQGVGANLIVNSRFSGVTFDGATSGASSNVLPNWTITRIGAGSANILVYNDPNPYVKTFSYTNSCVLYFNTGVLINDRISITSEAIPIKGNTTYEVSCKKFALQSFLGRINISYYDSTGTLIVTSVVVSNVTTETGSPDVLSNFSSMDNTYLGNPPVNRITSPSNAASCRIIIEIIASITVPASTTYNVYLTEPFFSEALVTQLTPSLYVDGPASLESLDIRRLGIYYDKHNKIANPTIGIIGVATTVYTATVKTVIAYSGMPYSLGSTNTELDLTFVAPTGTVRYDITVEFQWSDSTAFTWTNMKTLNSIACGNISVESTTVAGVLREFNIRRKYLAADMPSNAVYFRAAISHTSTTAKTFTNYELVLSRNMH